MIENFELLIVTIIILILMFVGFLPLIYLKFCKDLNNNVELYNTICNNDMNVNIPPDKQIKHTYMWNIANFLFEYDKLERYFYFADDKQHDKSKKKLNYSYSIINGQFNIMKIYNEYLHYNIPLFIILWIIFLLNIYNIINHNNYDINENDKYYLYSTLFSFLNIAIFTIIFSLILKKITEIYKDTNLYDYIMLLKELDIIIKQNNSANNEIINIIKQHSGDNIKSVGELSLNTKFIKTLLINKKKENTLYNNSKNYKLKLENLDKLELYNDKTNIDKINEKIDSITKLIPAYIILFFMSIYILSKCLKSNFTTISFIIILIYAFLIFIYIIKKHLE